MNGMNKRKPSEAQRRWNGCWQPEERAGMKTYGRNENTGAPLIYSNTTLAEAEVRKISLQCARLNASYAVVKADKIGGEDALGIEYRGTRPFERIRRITGYLVGTLDKWNDAKKAEERDRVKHLASEDPQK